jgi:glycerol-3-phosphate dehydrogenase (NAD(P)+)
VEGVPAARAVRDVADKLRVDMPICREVFLVLNEGRAIKAAVHSLMSREVRAEME